MYDKIKIWIDGVTMQDSTQNKIASSLDEAKEQTDIKTGEYKIYGCLNGLKVHIYGGGISVVGSMPKYLNGNNVFSLDRHSIVEAFAKLEDDLHLHLDDAKVTEMEFGNTFIMKKPVTAYLHRFGDISRLKRCQFADSTLYYKGQRKILCFYDKGAEAQDKRLILPEEIRGANLLRYELRYNGKLSRQFRCPVNVSTLSNLDFYMSMIDRYKKHYYSIKKYNKIQTNIMGKIKTVNDGVEVLLSRLINQYGQEVIGEFIDELKLNKVYPNRNSYARLNKKLQEISTNANATVTDELIKELDKKIDDVGDCV